MAWSLSPAGLPRPGSKSKDNHHQQNLQKMKDLSKKWVLTGKQFEDFRRKEEQKHNSRPLKNIRGTNGP